jgi:hypothetical protein
MLEELFIDDFVHRLKKVQEQAPDLPLRCLGRKGGC